MESGRAADLRLKHRRMATRKSALNFDMFFMPVYERELFSWFGSILKMLAEIYRERKVLFSIHVSRLDWI